jgi:hypothetical protein
MYAADAEDGHRAQTRALIIVGEFGKVLMPGGFPRMPSPTEVENLHLAVWRDFDVCRLGARRWMMPMLMRGFQCFNDLSGRWGKVRRSRMRPRLKRS